MPRDDRARAVILRRRLLFVSQALALCGCASSSSSQPLQEPTASAEPSTTGAAQPTTAAPGSAASSEATASASAQPGLPDLTPPAEASDELRAKYEKLGRNVRRLHARLDELGALTAAVEGDAKKAQASLADAGKAFNALERDSSAIRVLCKSGEPEQQAFEKRSNAHHALLLTRLAQLRQRWVTLVGEQALVDAKQKAYAAEPYPCLSIHCERWW
jgi:hypothetical protein